MFTFVFRIYILYIYVYAVVLTGNVTNWKQQLRLFAVNSAIDTVKTIVYTLKGSHLFLRDIQTKSKQGLTILPKAFRGRASKMGKNKDDFFQHCHWHCWVNFEFEYLGEFKVLIKTFQGVKQGPMGWILWKKQNTCEIEPLRKIFCNIHAFIKN